MSKIRGKNTSCERVVFTYLRKEGIYFQKHYRGVNGSPDIALPRKKKAVFIDGDFWHGHDFEIRRVKLTDFWRAKIIRNIERDKAINETLFHKGWTILRVWESEIKPISKRAEGLLKIKNYLLSKD